MHTMHKFLMPSCTAKLRIIQSRLLSRLTKKTKNKNKQKNKIQKKNQITNQKKKEEKKKKTYYMSHEEFRNKQVRVIALVLPFSGNHI